MSLPRVQSAQGPSPRREHDPSAPNPPPPSGIRLRLHDASTSSSLPLFTGAFSLPSPALFPPTQNPPDAPQSSLRTWKPPARVGSLEPGHGDADDGLRGRGGASPGGLDAACGGRERQCVLLGGGWTTCRRWARAGPAC